MTRLLSPLSATERSQACKAEPPTWYEPMLATLSHDPFADDDWIYERKLDGERAFAYVRSSGEITLYSRNRKVLNNSYPELVDALAEQTPQDCILDGEVVAFNDNNISDFQLLQPRMQSDDKDEARRSGTRIFYYLFDCLYLDGYDVRGCSQRSRKKLLRSAISWKTPLRLTPYRNRSGISYYRQACARGWEGVIAKAAAAPYQQGRSRQWLKFKCIHQQEFVIAGFTEPEGQRTGLRALLLGVYEDNRLIYTGKVGTGFDEQTLQDLRTRLDRLHRKTSPFSGKGPSGKATHFVTPRLVCEVAFTEWTDDGCLRHPRFLGLRRDKSAEHVVRETTSRNPER